jgi:phage terminase large subunit-like protein
MIFELDDGDDWNDPEVWIKANPRMIDDPYFLETSLMKQYTQAKNEGGQKETDFKCKHLNIWLSSAEAFINDDNWQKCNLHPVELKDFEGKEVWLGIDLAGGIDINACCFLYPDPNGILQSYWMMWIPAKKVREAQDGVDYSRWVQEGWIRVAGDDTIDQRIIVKDIVDAMRTMNVKAIDFDAKMAYDGVVQGLQEAGYDEVLRPLGQNSSTLGAPVDELERLALDKKVNHGGNPVIRWMMGNTTMFVDTGGFRRPDKKKSINKIDGVAAMVDSVAGWMQDRIDEDDEIQIFF